MKVDLETEGGKGGRKPEEGYQTNNHGRRTKKKPGRSHRRTCMSAGSLPRASLPRRSPPALYRIDNLIPSSPFNAGVVVVLVVAAAVRVPRSLSLPRTNLPGVPDRSPPPTPPACPSTTQGDRQSVCCRGGCTAALPCGVADPSSDKNRK